MEGEAGEERVSEARVRTVRWEAPQRGPAAARSMSGLAYLEAIVRGDLPPPPIAALVGFDMVEVSEGRAVFTAAPGEHHFNVLGGVHGGWAATLLDSAMGCAVLSTLPAGTTFTTVQLNLHYVRAAPVGAVVRCEGKVVHRGRTISTAEGTLLDPRGKVVAHGTTTCAVMPLERPTG